MIIRSNFRKALGAFLSALLVLVVAAGISSAQTKKKKKHAAHKKPAAAKTKAQSTNGDAGVISLASQYQDGSSQIIDPSASPTPATETNSDDNSRKLRDMQSRIKKLENTKSANEEDRQKRLLTNLDILSKADQRSDELRKQRFDLMEKENSIQLRLDQIEIDMRPEMIERSVAVSGGSMRPEEVRDAKLKSFQTEKQSLQNLLTEVTATRNSVELSLQRSDAMAEKLRTALEKEIDSIDPDHPDDQ